MVTGRVIPPGGLPKDVDAAVANVETLMNIGLDRPVTHKYLTVAGAVANPVTLRVPVGISIGEVIEAAGGADRPRFRRAAGRRDDGQARRRAWTCPVTKTTGGIIVLPAEHALIRRHNAPWMQIANDRPLGLRSVPLLHRVLPALSARPSHPAASRHAVAGLSTGADAMVATLYCCECNLCTMFACPEDLDPKNVCVQAKPLARERGLTFKGTPESITPHPMAEFRRVPMRRLIAGWAWASSTTSAR